MRVRKVLSRLARADRGWVKLLKAHGLNIVARDLGHELQKPLRIDRDVPGFEDFALEGTRGIESGSPAKSLLYHALASPQVLTCDGEASLRAFPTPAEIEVVENYVFGVRPPTIQDLRVRSDDAPLAIAVFAYEYRPAIDTVHRKHADLCYSRTGICRVGTEPAKYDLEGGSRAYLPTADAPNRVRVLPCRYAAFIASKCMGDENSFGPMRFRTEPTGKPPDEIESDAELCFWVPIHKLFDGDECIRGQNIQVRLHSHHVNEKLRRIQRALNARRYTATALSNPPFVLTQGLAELSEEADDGNGLLVPAVHGALVEAAYLGNRRVTYSVPENLKKTQLESTSFSIAPAEDGQRTAPEFVHARHKIDSSGSFESLNDSPHLKQVLKKGGYEAQHYLDFTGDGWIEAVCRPGFQLPKLAAYSLVTPPKFYPFVTPLDLMDWWENSAPRDIARSVWPYGDKPLPLSDRRYPANLNLRRAKFEKTDNTIIAIVSSLHAGSDRQARLVNKKRPRVSSLPDGASGVFDPGWECSTDLRRPRRQVPKRAGSAAGGVTHLAAYGLGSPFPEDGKLCAAESAFWPLAAPDIRRSFAPDSTTFIVTPLLDELTGQTAGEAPWDRIPGPDYPKGRASGTAVFSALSYGDWVETALRNGFRFGLLSKMTAKEYEEHTVVMQRVYQALGAVNGRAKANLAVLSFTRAKTSDPELQRAQRVTRRRLVRAHSYRFIIIRHIPHTRATVGPFGKLEVAFKAIYKIFADQQSVLVHETGGGWTAHDF
jgi:hypothetical protein